MKSFVCTIDETVLEPDLHDRVERMLDRKLEADGMICPACGSARTVRIPAGFLESECQHSACRGCGAFWESLPAGEPYERDGEQIPFKEPCDNCAFRAGSPESQNRDKWRELLQRLKAGGRFYCHKAVPIDPDGGFDFPTKADAKAILVPDEDRMRMCRGFLNAWAKWEGIR